MATLAQAPDPIDGQTPEERRAAELIGRVLRTSVVTAATLVVLGLGLVVLDPSGAGRPTLDSALGRSGALAHVSPRSIGSGIRGGNGQDLIMLGLMVLIVSPSVRVAITMLVFMRERRRVLAALAGVVLVILVLGLVGIGA